MSTHFDDSKHRQDALLPFPMLTKSIESRAGAGFALDPTPLRITRLKTLDDVRVELARIYREARAEKLPLDRAKGLAYLLSLMSGLIKETDLERRVVALEETKNGADA